MGTSDVPRGVVKQDCSPSCYGKTLIFQPNISSLEIWPDRPAFA